MEGRLQPMGSIVDIAMLDARNRALVERGVRAA